MLGFCATVVKLRLGSAASRRSGRPRTKYEKPKCNPNHIVQALIAVLAGWGVPFVCTETHELGEEIIASYLYQVHLYHWLESNGYGKWLSDDDL